MNKSLWHLECDKLRNTKSKKEKAFDEIKSIMDTWSTSGIMPDYEALRQIDDIINEVINNENA